MFPPAQTGRAVGATQTRRTGRTAGVTHDRSGRAFYAGLLEALIQVMGSAKGYLRDHGPRVAMLATQIANHMGMGRKDVSDLFFAAVLADVGMVGLAEDAWENAVPELPPDVRASVELHPIRSEAYVAGIPHLQGLAPLVRSHHEWWDGRGYPDRLQGDEIPMGAQILRLSDTVAALTQDRPHRATFHPDEVLEVVEAGAGREFGPEVADTYTSLHRSGDIPGFEPTAFRHSIARATEHVLPEAVSPLSSNQLLDILANLVDAKDPSTAGHSRRVALLTVAVAGQFGLDGYMKSTLWAGGYLHDVGKLRVPLRVLTKQGRLTDEEFALVRRHPDDGARILEAIPSLRHLTAGVRYHHERWDGRGYPEGLSGDHIPFAAQIMSVCDAYDAMTSKRAYRGLRTHEGAMEEIERNLGTHFSPRAGEAFLSLPEALFETVRSQRPEDTDPTERLAPARRPSRAARPDPFPRLRLRVSAARAYSGSERPGTLPS